MNVATRRALIELSFLALLFFGSFAGNLRVISADNVTKWLLVSGVTAITSTLTINLAWLIQLKRRGGASLSLPAAVMVSAFVGAVFAVTQQGVMRALSLVGEREPLVAAISSVVTITIIGVAISVFVTGRRAEEERRAQLLEEGIAVALAREDVTDIARRMQMSLGSEISDALAPARLSIEERLADQERSMNQDEWSVIASELRLAAHETVRPLSRRLWAGTAARSRPIRFGEVLRNIVTRQPFQPVPLALLLIVGSLASSLSLYGWIGGIASLSFGVAAIFLVLGAANAAMNRWPRHHVFLFVLGGVILEAFALLNFPLRQWLGAQPYTWAEAVAAISIGFLLILLTSGAGSLRTYREDVARTFQADIDREALESVAASREVAQLAREAARILHGTIQTRLIACAVAIERASSSQDVVAFQSALREAHNALSSHGLAEEDYGTSIDSEVHRKVSLWSSLCTIDVSIDPSIGVLDGRLARDVGRVVEEGMSNAIRHGAATSIHVSVVNEDDGIVVTIHDNGRGPQGGAKGLGSSLLESVSSAWELRSFPSGTSLRVQLTR